VVLDAVKQYKEEVKELIFPSKKESFILDSSEKEKLTK
jgi:ketopantoate hydroxymethyltransferase